MSKPRSDVVSTSSATAGETTPAITPSPTGSESSSRGPVPLSQFRDMDISEMGEQPKQQASDSSKPADEPVNSNTEEVQDESVAKPKSKKKSKCNHKRRSKDKKSQTTSPVTTKKDDESDSDSDSDSDSSSSEASVLDTSSSSSDSSSDDEPVTKKKSKSKSSKKSKDKSRRRKASESDSDSTESGDESSEEETRKKKRSKKSSKKAAKDKKRKKAKKDSDSEESVSDEGESEADDESEQDLQAQIDDLKRKLKRQSGGHKSGKSKKRKAKKNGKATYRRVDQLWDTETHDYKLSESAEHDDSEFAEHAFLVRRCFNWENKYTDTVIDIKSKQLRTVLTDVMKNCKSVSLEAEEPIIEPNVLFLYLEELRSHYKALKAKIKATKKSKAIKKLTQHKDVCKLLVKYLDEDYADTKKKLYPLLEHGNITFELLWALYKPNEIAVTSCYGSWDEPRCFKVDYANKSCSMTRGDWYCIEGRYVEYDGKSFGHGDLEIDVESFKGPRKISSLATYPLKYHRDPEGVKKTILERGQKFINMEGQQYKFMKGMAFMKKKKGVVAKVNINGRIMVDPAMFRRILPNYQISTLSLHEDVLFSESEDDESDCGCCGESDDEDGGHDQAVQQADGTLKTKYKYTYKKDKTGNVHYVRVEVDENGVPIRGNGVSRVAQLDGKNSFSEEELLLTSPVVLGFAFSEKLWLEFSISAIEDITFNDKAFDALVLPPSQKDIVRALVESHKSYGDKSIDDVVVGKGGALNCILHGPPGTGKTLTAESISELLKCPLYMVSAGELGVDPAKLEFNLQQILDIASSWKAILLIDEADVFLEARELHDLQRNALVSIFLRLLEYYSGILILTTNRVNTFDDAFQSRIHIALRYGELSTSARMAVWKMFIGMVQEKEGSSAVKFGASDLEALGRHSLNGRQIKNIVKSSQSLALFEKTSMSMLHIKKVLEVVETFDRDLKGGTGYIDAMRSYM